MEMLNDLERKNREQQLEKRPGHTPSPGLDMKHVLEVMEKFTGRYWMYFVEEELFEHYDWETLLEKCREYEDVYIKFSESTNRKLTELGHQFD